METTKIKLIFSIFGENFNPVELNKILNINGTSFHKKGDNIPNRPSLTWKETSWSFSTGFVDTLFFDEVAHVLVNALGTKVDDILKVVQENKLEAKLFSVIEIVDENKPAIYMSRRFLDFLDLFEAEIDLDMSIYSNE